MGRRLVEGRSLVRICRRPLHLHRHHRRLWELENLAVVLDLDLVHLVANHSVVDPIVIAVASILAVEGGEQRRGPMLDDGRALDRCLVVALRLLAVYCHSEMGQLLAVVAADCYRVGLLDVVRVHHGHRAIRRSGPCPLSRPRELEAEPHVGLGTCGDLIRGNLRRWEYRLDEQGMVGCGNKDG